MNHIAPYSRKPVGSIFVRPGRGPKLKERASKIEELKKRTFDSTRLFHVQGWILAGPNDVIPIRPHEAVLLIAVTGRRMATKDDVMEALWPNPDLMPDFWADQIRELVHRLRRSLKQVGASEEIVTAWGRGFYLRRNTK
ncbi:MAG: hypothetical protein CMO06_09705 [Thalassospira sp.]|uniref:helix-turn-helix domain-containing protein n=1 Tax=Thalassospira sp. TaxID=1912094 RepID=UPI000C606E1F|nr:helix-turn-helix domain-containing protein [Thalassospira sp.]MAZ33406.1 hypothetical protein [Thalassospira sp.]